MSDEKQFEATQQLLKVISFQNTALQYQIESLNETVLRNKPDFYFFDSIRKNMAQTFFKSIKITQLLIKCKQEIQNGKNDENIEMSQNYLNIDFLANSFKNQQNHKHSFADFSSELSQIQFDHLKNKCNEGVNSICHETTGRAKEDYSNDKSLDLNGPQSYRLSSFPTDSRTRNKFKDQMEKSDKNQKSSLILNANHFSNNEQHFNLISNNFDKQKTDNNQEVNEDVKPKMIKISTKREEEEDFQNNFEEPCVNHQILDILQSVHENEQPNGMKNLEFILDEFQSFQVQKIPATDYLKYRQLYHDHINRRKRGKYKICPGPMKDQIVRICENHSLKTAAEIFMIPEKNIKRWMCRGGGRKKGAGRKTMDPMMEAGLLKWIEEYFKTFNIFPVFREIKTQAKMFTKNDKFMASKGWCDKFMKRNVVFFKNLQNQQKDHENERFDETSKSFL